MGTPHLGSYCRHISTDATTEETLDGGCAGGLGHLRHPILARAGDGIWVAASSLAGSVGLWLRCRDYVRIKNLLANYTMFENYGHRSCFYVCKVLFQEMNIYERENDESRYHIMLFFLNILIKLLITYTLIINFNNTQLIITFPCQFA